LLLVVLDLVSDSGFFIGRHCMPKISSTAHFETLKTFIETRETLFRASELLKNFVRQHFLIIL